MRKMYAEDFVRFLQEKEHTYSERNYLLSLQASEKNIKQALKYFSIPVDYSTHGGLSVREYLDACVKEIWPESPYTPRDLVNLFIQYKKGVSLEHGEYKKARYKTRPGKEARQW
jgi:hypothetical protein